ncbi:MAG: Asp-tRNA(Asn)/Glu-tRNA(Gln) amidotransferase subunit GatC [Candidatus Aenigmarchaeota archaeon]|nr:Asp-tRNA(Asn)/Glu-tRNA(Gln) amidotransferase subunit GatC [Candidatus Aenigmarchaeota archaeon]
MSIDRETVKRVAEVARLRLTDRETEKFSRDLGDILGAFKELERVDTKNVKPTFQPIEVKNVLREDKAEKSLSREEALSNTKNKEEGYFKGPRVV